MGSLRDLESEHKNVHLLISSSSLVEMFVYDTLKEFNDCTVDSVYMVENKSQFNEMLGLVNLQPYMAKRWLFYISYNKNTKALLKAQEGIFRSESSCFFVVVKTYREFKEVKEFLPGCNDLYLSILRKREISYLYRDIELPGKLLDFICGSYAREPEKVLELREKLLNGLEVKTQKDITNLVGVSAGSVNSFIFLLLVDQPKTEVGYKRVIKKRVQLFVGLLDAYGVSTFYNFVKSALRDMLDLKMLYMQGIIFNSVRGLPEQYDESRLSRYGYCLSRIIEVPYIRMLSLYRGVCLRRWCGASDVVGFIYKWYSGR